jgi:hypothetical protein
MGTNFYIRGFHRYGDRDPKFHAGKRSGAGSYCWDCKITLCAAGNDAVHMGKSSWFETCPKCGSKPIKESLDDSAIGKELGFNQSSLKRTGVRGVCSFSWGIHPNTLATTVLESCISCPSCQRAYEDPEKVIEDEYGKLFTLEEFQEILADCPIQYYDSIGTIFF